MVICVYTCESVMTTKGKHAELTKQVENNELENGILKETSYRDTIGMSASGTS